MAIVKDELSEVLSHSTPGTLTAGAADMQQGKQHAPATPAFSAACFSAGTKILSVSML
jgi:hypothetical protein